MTAVQQGRQMCSALVQDINNGRIMFDEWAENTKKILEDKTAEHKAAMQSNEELLSALRKKEKTLKIEGSKVQKEAELEKNEHQDAELKVKQLKEKEAILPQQLEASKRALQLQVQALEKLTAEVAEVEKTQKHRFDELAKGAAFYSERLGLRFERFEDRENHLRFTMVKIDKQNPRREFYFDIYVQDSIYDVLCCEPAIPGVQEKLKALNESNDLSAFVRSMRRGFRQLVEQQ